ncbi:hypothetical protein Pmar_PMAR016789, partial [Perkinsus marinus ATCC 50983]
MRRETVDGVTRCILQPKWQGGSKSKTASNRVVRLTAASGAPGSSRKRRGSSESSDHHRPSPSHSGSNKKLRSSTPVGSGTPSGYGYRGERRRIAELESPSGEDSSRAGLVSLECSDTWESESNQSPKSVTIAQGSSSVQDDSHGDDDDHVDEGESMMEEEPKEWSPSSPLPLDIINSIKTFVYEEFS